MFSPQESPVISQDRIRPKLSALGLLAQVITPPYIWMDEVTDGSSDPEQVKKYYQQLEKATLSTLPFQSWEWLMPALDRLGPTSMLELGCGMGGLTNKLSERLSRNRPVHAVGVDINSTAIRLANERKIPYASFVEADITRLPPDFVPRQLFVSKAALVTSYFTGHHLNEDDRTKKGSIDAMLSLVATASRLGENFVIVDTNRRFLPGYCVAPLLALILSGSRHVAFDTLASYFRGYTYRDLRERLDNKINIYDKGFDLVITNVKPKPAKK